MSSNSQFELNLRKRFHNAEPILSLRSLPINDHRWYDFIHTFAMIASGSFEDFCSGCWIKFVSTHARLKGCTTFPASDEFSIVHALQQSTSSVTALLPIVNGTIGVSIFHFFVTATKLSSEVLSSESCNLGLEGSGSTKLTEFLVILTSSDVFLEFMPVCFWKYC